MSNIFGIGLSGLNAAKVSITTTGHNIANVSTPGYNRQTVEQAARVPQQKGFGFEGDGVNVTHVLRHYNKFLDTQVLEAQSDYSYYENQTRLLGQIDALLGEQSVGLTQAVQDIFSALQTVSGNPADLPGRQVVLGMASALINKFQVVDEHLVEVQGAVNAELQFTAQSVSQIASNIADLNREIMSLSSKGQGKLPNDLLDQRDVAMQQLNKLVHAVAVTDETGNFNVFIGNGQSLVLGNVPMQVSTRLNPRDPQELQLTTVDSNGTVTVIPDRLVTGGALGGGLSARAMLAQLQTNLGNLAIDLTTSLNYQQSLGIDLNKKAGAALFSDLTEFADPSAAVGKRPQDAVARMSLLLVDPAGLACSSNMTATNLSGNGGGANASSIVTSVVATLPETYKWVNATTPPTVDDHPAFWLANDPATISVDAGTMTATIVGGAHANTVYDVVSDPLNNTSTTKSYKLIIPGTNPVQDAGITFSVLGALPATMKFDIVPRTTGANNYALGDGGNVLQMVNLQTAKLVDDKRGPGAHALQSFESYYTTTVSSLGSSTNTAQRALLAATAVLQEETLARSNGSGVNLDEEGAKLIQYQHAYQGSSKVIQVASTLFDTILQIFR